MNSVKMESTNLYKAIQNKNIKFAIFAPSKINFSDKENKEKTLQLLQDIKDLKLGYNKLVCIHFKKVCEDDNQKGAEFVDRSILVYNIPRYCVISFAKKYKQNLVLYKDKKIIKFYDNNGKKTDEIPVLENSSQNLNVIYAYYNKKLEENNDFEKIELRQFHISSMAKSIMFYSDVDAFKYYDTIVPY